MLWRSGHDPRKHHVRSQALEQLGSHSRHTVEPRQPAERTMLLAPSDDSLSEGGPDSREPCDLRHVGAVEVDAFTGQERSREPGGLPRGGGEPSRGRRIHGHESHVAGRRGLRGGERQSRARAREGEKGEQQRSAAVVHADTVTTRPRAFVIRFMRASPRNCGSRVRNVEWGMRNVSGDVAAQLDLSFQFRIPHSTFRIVTAPVPQRHPRQLAGTPHSPCRSCLPSCASTGSRSPRRRSRGCPPSAARRGRRSGCVSRRG